MLHCSLILAPEETLLELYQYPIIIALGILSGFFNTVAGGGSLITLPFLIFMGLPGSEANATNRIAVFTQAAFATAGFRSKGIRLPVPYIYYLAASALVGAFIGAKLAVDISDQLFNRVLAVTMIGIVVLTVRDRGRGQAVATENMTLKSKIMGVIGFLFISLYGGFLQAGMGFVIIALFTGVNRFNLVKTNFIKVVLTMAMTLISLVVFAVEGTIRWEYGIMLAIGYGIGGWYASRWSVDKGEKWIKRVLVAAVVILAIKLWFFQ